VPGSSPNLVSSHSILRCDAELARHLFPFRRIPMGTLQEWCDAAVFWAAVAAVVLVLMSEAGA
jgi:hypothetical protein